MTNLARKLVFSMVENEMDRQVEKWGKQDHDDWLWLIILVEEVGEAAQAILQGNYVLDEVIHVAAVAASWLESRCGARCK